jgi:hypothetical protein
MYCICTHFSQWCTAFLRNRPVRFAYGGMADAGVRCLSVRRLLKQQLAYARISIF